MRAVRADGELQLEEELVDRPRIAVARAAELSADLAELRGPEGEGGGDPAVVRWLRFAEPRSPRPEGTFGHISEHPGTSGNARWLRWAIKREHFGTPAGRPATRRVRGPRRPRIPVPRVSTRPARAACGKGPWRLVLRQQRRDGGDPDAEGAAAQQRLRQAGGRLHDEQREPERVARAGRHAPQRRAIPSPRAQIQLGCATLAPVNPGP